MSLDPHLRWKGEEEGNPGLVARNTEWFCSSRGVRASAGVEVTIIVSQPMQRYMARRTSNKIQPAVMTIPLSHTFLPNSFDKKFIDLSQIASLMNRRFYRQGINWAVAGFKFVIRSDSGDPTIPNVSPEGSLQMFKLPNTWVMSNAWEKSMRAWLKMNNKALAEAESVRPRFMDFKVYANSSHHTDGFGANWLPVNYTPGEWESSKVFVPEPYNVTPSTGTDTMNTLELVATGASFPGASAATGLDAVSLIEGYANSRSLPARADPNTPDDASDVAGATPQNWLSAIFNEGITQDADVIEELTTENIIAPYPFENDGTNVDTMYPNGAIQSPDLQLHDTSIVSGTTIGGTTRMKGGNFPCGLIQVSYLNRASQNATLTLLIDLVPGHHRGYLCEPMTEM